MTKCNPNNERIKRLTLNTILTKQDKALGIDAARIKTALTKGLNGDKLTSYQQLVWEDLNRIADRESTKSYAKQLEAFERVTKGEGYAEQIEQIVSESVKQYPAERYRGILQNYSTVIRVTLAERGYSPEQIKQIAREAIAKYAPERYRGTLGNYIAVGEVGLAKLGYDAKQLAQIRPYLEKIARDLRDRHARQIWMKEAPSRGEGKSFTPELAEINKKQAEAHKAII